MSLESTRVKVEAEDEERGPELLEALDVAWPRAGPSDDHPEVRNEVTVQACSPQDQTVMQGLELEPELIKEEEDKELEEWYCGVSEEAARAGLYAGHTVKHELVLGPELLHEPDVAVKLKGVRVESLYTAPPPLTAGEPSDDCPKEGPQSHRAEIELKTCLVRLERIAIDTKEHALYPSSCVGQAERSIHDRTLQPGLIKEQQEYSTEEKKEEICGVSETAELQGVRVDSLYTAPPPLTAGEPSDDCPKEGPQSHRAEIELKTCFVRLERIAIDTKEHALDPSSCVGQAERSIHDRSLKPGLVKEQQYSAEEKKEEICGVSEAAELQGTSAELRAAEAGATEGESGTSCEPRTASQDGADEGWSGECLGEGLDCSTRRSKQFMLRPCAVRLERISFNKHIGSREKHLYKRSALMGHLQSVKEVFLKKAVFRQHKLADKLIKCDVCNEMFSNRYRLKVHRRIHTGEKLYECDICNIQFIGLSIFIQHRRIHTGEKPHACNICNKKFSRLAHLNRHKQTHTGEKPHACRICNKRFTSSTSLIIHKRIHTGEKLHACDICNKRFTHSSTLTYHKRIHTGEKPYTCDICNKKFYHRGRFNEHKRVHTGERPYACDICKKKFKTLGHLKQHKPIHTGDKPYACDICNKHFTLLTCLIVHKRTHTGEKRYACNICNKKYSGSYSLIEHKRNHMGVKPYQCDVCNKQFNNKSNMKEHIRIHTGEKPFVCNICNKRFTHSRTLVVHKLVHLKKNRPSASRTRATRVP